MAADSAMKLLSGQGLTDFGVRIRQRNWQSVKRRNQDAVLTGLSGKSETWNKHARKQSDRLPHQVMAQYLKTNSR